jgi:SAM-dependent methyltransferase
VVTGSVINIINNKVINLEELYNHINRLDQPHTGEIAFYDPVLTNDVNLASAIDMVKDVVSRTNPSNILEIGFNRGSSSLLFLYLSSANVTSIDIVNKPESVKYLTNTFTNRFSFVLGNSFYLDMKSLGTFDLVFIDGDHEYNSIVNDIEQSLKVNPKFILFDDYEHPAHGVDTKKAISLYPKLVFESSYFNQALFSVKQ